MASTTTGEQKSWFAKVEGILYQKNAVTDQLEKVEQKTGVKRLYLVLVIAVLVGVYLLFGYGAGILCNVIGFAYPAYASIKAIESQQKDDDTKWLTYWVVFSVFHFVEYFADIFVFWVPFYWLAKCLFMIYCMVPVSWNGSLVIYRRFIRPFILRYEDKIDDAVDKATAMADKALRDGKHLATDAAVRHMAGSDDK